MWFGTVQISVPADGQQDEASNMFVLEEQYVSWDTWTQKTQLLWPLAFHRLQMSNISPLQTY